MESISKRKFQIYTKFIILHILCFTGEQIQARMFEIIRRIQQICHYQQNMYIRFNSFFKKKFSISPIEYRKSYIRRIFLKENKFEKM